METGSNLRLFRSRLLIVGSVLGPLIGGAMAADVSDHDMGPLPAVSSPADNPSTSKKVHLGQEIFSDTRLSRTGKMSCATCHVQSLYFTDGRSRARGNRGEDLPKNAPTLLNAAYSKHLFWDGRMPTLELQAMEPFKNDQELAVGAQELIDRVSAVPEYRRDFAEAFPGRSISTETIAMAIASYERTLVTANSPFDRFARGQCDALSPSARHGHDLFMRWGQCFNCHSGPNFSDGKFHNTGVPGESAGRSEDFKARTPSLRNIAGTAPYMHNGVFKTLPEVVDFYNRGGGGANVDPHLRPLTLKDSDKADLVAFLESLTDDDIAAASSKQAVKPEAAAPAAVRAAKPPYQITLSGDFKTSAHVEATEGASVTGFGIAAEKGAGADSGVFVLYVSSSAAGTPIRGPSRISLVKYDRNGKASSSTTVQGAVGATLPLILDEAGDLYLAVLWEQGASGLAKFDSNLKLLQTSVAAPNKQLGPIVTMLYSGGELYTIHDGVPGQGAKVARWDKSLRLLGMTDSIPSELNTGGKMAIDRKGILYATAHSGIGFCSKRSVFKFSKDLKNLLASRDVSDLYRNDLGIAESDGRIDLFTVSDDWTQLYIKRLDSDLNYTGVSSTFDGLAVNFKASLGLPKAAGKGFYIAVPSDRHDFLVLKYDQDLKVVSQWHYDGAGGGQAMDVAVSDSGDLYVTGAIKAASDQTKLVMQTLKVDSSLMANKPSPSADSAALGR